MTGGPTHVAFLRSINVGGRRLTMAELTAPLSAVGVDVRATWQATGNLVLHTPDGASPAALAATCEDALRAGLGIEVPTIVRTVAKVRALVDDVPFTPDQLAATEGHVQVLLVRDAPGSAVVEEVLATHATPDDELVWRHGALWWLPRAGVSTSSLRVPAVERALGVCTMRTHRALEGLVRARL